MAGCRRTFSSMAVHVARRSTDEYSFPIILAYHIAQANALQGFDPNEMVLGAAGAISYSRSYDPQERWVERRVLPANARLEYCRPRLRGRLARNDGAIRYSQFSKAMRNFLNRPWKSGALPRLGHWSPIHHTISDAAANVKNAAAQPPTPPPSLPEIPIPRRSLSTDHLFSHPPPANSLVDCGFPRTVRYGIRPANDPPSPSTPVR